MITNGNALIGTRSCGDGDPSRVIAQAIHFGIIGRVNRQGVPSSIREELKHRAKAGETACELVLEWLDDLLLIDLEAAEQQLSF